MVKNFNLFDGLVLSQRDKSTKPSQESQSREPAYRTISQAAKHLGVATHVLRFWETKFPQIKPMKRNGGRRYYRKEDVKVLEEIQTLLHKEGYTIKGVQALLAQKSKSNMESASSPSVGNAIPAHFIEELKDIRRLLN